MHAEAAEIASRSTPKMRLIAVRHLDGRTRAATKARKLAASFEAALAKAGEVTAATHIAIERAAALVVVAEDARARRLGGDMTVTLDDLVRVDRVAAQALRALGISVKPEPP
jgi:hypothetical protein